MELNQLPLYKVDNLKYESILPILITLKNYTTLDINLRIGYLSSDTGICHYQYKDTDDIKKAIQWLIQYATKLFYFDQNKTPVKLFIDYYNLINQFQMPHINHYLKSIDMFNNEPYLPLYILNEDETTTEVAYLFTDRSISINQYKTIFNVSN